MLRIICISFAIMLMAPLMTSPLYANTVLPIEAYASLPEVTRVKLSSNGQYLSYVKSIDGTLVLVVVDLIEGKSTPILRADNVEVMLNWYEWANDETILVSARYATNDMGLTYTNTRLFKMNIKTETELTSVYKPRPSKDGRSSREHEPQFQDNVISLLPDDPDNILISWDLVTPNEPEVYRVNVNNLHRARVIRNKANIRHWYADMQGRVRIGYGVDDTKIFYRLLDLETEEWRTIYEYESISSPDISIVGFDLDPSIIYIRALHDDTYALYKVNTNDPTLKKELVFVDPNYDFDGSLLRAAKTGQVIGFTHSGLDGGRKYWDNDYLKLQRGLDKAFPNAINSIIDMDRQHNSYVLYNASGDDPGSYYLGNRKNKSLDYIGSRYPMITAENYAGKQLVSYKARDGLTIEGYLTLPLARDAEQPLPAIIFPHGGPSSRDYGDFDYLSELLANQGYVVLQPNFRGSEGYGFSFNQAANWGEEMQDDLEDAALWLVEQGYTRKDTICIGGMSYGGYAALMAAVKHPDTFKCAASVAGVSDLELLVSKSRNYLYSKIRQRQFGDDDDKLEKNSPVNHAKKITIPILLIHGSDDRVVPVEHSEDMVQALKRNNKDVRYIELEGGDHYLSNQGHRMTTLKEISEFFDKNLKSE